MMMRLGLLVVSLVLTGSVFAEHRFYRPHLRYYGHTYPYGYGFGAGLSYGGTASAPNILRVGRPYTFGFSSGYGSAYPYSYGAYGGYYGRLYSSGYPFTNRTYGYNPRPAAGAGIYRIVLGPPAAGGVVRANYSDVVFRVTPASALIFIDGKLIGSGRDFSTERSGYRLLDGEYELRVEHPGYAAFESTLDVTSDRTLHFDIELRPAASNH